LLKPIAMKQIFQSKTSKGWKAFRRRLRAQVEGLADLFARDPEHDESEWSPVRVKSNDQQTPVRDRLLEDRIA